VGAGPTGLCLAISLLRNGVPVRIIDKAQEPRVGQKGFGIQASGGILDGVPERGILDEVLERASYIKNMLIYEMPGAVKVARARVLETSPKVPATPDKPWPDSRLLGQDRFEAILTRHLEAAGGKIERGVELLGFKQDDNHVYAELRKHAQRDTEHAQFDFLIGCDGGHSIVRRFLGLAFVGETRDAEWSLIADVVVRGLDSNYWHIFSNGSGPKDMRLTLRSADIPEISTIIDSGDRETYADPREALTVLIKDFYAITGRTDIEFGEVKCASWYRPNIRMVDRFGDGRVFVAGDAAHTHSPAGGQGMNSGIQDGFNLAWKLALVHKKLAPLTLLATYSSERLPVIATMLQKTTEISEAFVKAAYQQRTDPATGEWKRDGAMKQFGVNYRGSDIVLDERNPLLDAMPSAYGSGDGVLRAGDRAPSAPVRYAADKGVQKMFDVFSCQRHTILVFSSGEVGRGVVDVLISLPEGLSEVFVVTAPEKAHSDDELTVLEDFAGHARSIYQVDHDPTIAIIRPDGVIGAIVLEAYGIWRYFAKILDCVDLDSVSRL
ncbi:FAD binding domain-containing protein, partial [Schizophyllum commune]